MRARGFEGGDVTIHFPWGRDPQPAGRSNHSGERQYALPPHAEPEWLLDEEALDLEIENRSR